LKFLIAILITAYTFATPRVVEVYFLSEVKKETSYKLLEDKFKAFKLTAQVDMSKCVPMGDGCFHPQVGYIEGDSGKGVIEQQDGKAKDVELKTINSLEVDMIDCKEGNYFDIFCGKAKKEKRGKIHYEIWVDTSASMRRVDWSKDASHCYRRTFIENIERKCNVDVSMFDTSIKQVGSHDSLCLTYGLNDQDRMIQWVKDSSADHLLIITDIDESSVKLRNFFLSINAQIHGADYGDFTGPRLINHVEELSKACQNKKK
jgi:hypothetical protein